MNAGATMSTIRQFGETQNYTRLPRRWLRVRFTTCSVRPVYDDAYFPDFSGTTGAANIAVVGDFSTTRSCAVPA